MAPIQSTGRLLKSEQHLASERAEGGPGHISIHAHVWMQVGAQHGYGQDLGNGSGSQRGVRQSRSLNITHSTGSVTPPMPEPSPGQEAGPVPD